MDFLKYEEEVWPVAFIEDIFWLSGALFNLKAELDDKDEAIAFVLDCERGRGGFSRGKVIGIQTLENTYYGVSVLRITGYF